MKSHLWLCFLCLVAAPVWADDGADWARLVDETVAAETARPIPSCPAGTWPDLTIAEGRVTDAAILREIGGYAGAAKTTGGLGGKLAIVTNLADYDSNRDDPIPGSLRAAIDEAREAHTPVWIVFDPALGPHAKIAMKDTLRPPDNVTLDGSCADVTLEAPDSAIVFAYIHDVRNVIVTRLAFHKTGYVPELHPDDDSAIRLNGDVDRIAILHNDLSECGDGCIDITTSPDAPVPAAARITVADNFIHDHDKAMLFGTFDCPSGDQCDADYFRRHLDVAPGLFLTLDGNLFLRTGQRHPRVYGRVMAHIANNFFAFGKRPRPDGHGGVYGIFVSDDARALIERNFFLPLAPQYKIPLAVWTKLSRGALDMTGDVEGFVRLRDNAVLGNAVAEEDRPELVPEPPYRLDLVALDRLPPARALACVADRAGRAGAARWNPRLCAP